MMSKKQKSKHRKKKQSQSSKPPKMTAHEFVKKLVDDKDFRRSITLISYDLPSDKDDPEAMPKWLNAGARSMGYRFTDDEFVGEFNSQLRAVGVFKRTRILGGILGTMNASRKYLEKHEKEMQAAKGK